MSSELPTASTTFPAPGMSGGLPPRLRRAADLSDLTDGRLLRALTWWRDLAAAEANAIPDRSRLDPGAIPDLLPYAMLWDVVPQADAPGGSNGGPESWRYRSRLTGTMIDEMRGGAPRGQWMHERFGTEAARAGEDHDAVVRLARPMLFERDLGWIGKPYYRYRRLILPFTHRAAAMRSADPALRRDAGRVALLFNVISFIGE